MKMSPTAARLIVLIATLVAVLVAVALSTADAAPRQFPICSPNEDVCLGPLDCCSGQCVNAVCCDEYLGTCFFDYAAYPYQGPYWKRGAAAATATVSTSGRNSTDKDSTTEPGTLAAKEEATTANSL